jgi:hypothetical protein
MSQVRPPIEGGADAGIGKHRAQTVRDHQLINGLPLWSKRVDELRETPQLRFGQLGVDKKIVGKECRVGQN